jgi:membrane fusion protein, heavy metal efflux system
MTMILKPVSLPAGSLPADDQPPVDVLRAGRLRNVARALPTVIAFAFLAGVFYLGHHTGWKMPRFSSLMTGGERPGDDWCSAHLVAESECVECQDDLLPRLPEFGFCRTHGVAECVGCHPELAQVKGEPAMPRYDTARAIALSHRPENNSRNTLHKHRVQLASDRAATKAGIDVDVVDERPMIETIRANGEVTFDPTRVAHLSSRVGGNLAYIAKTVGDDVQPGDILALVDSAQVGTAKSQLLHALVQYRLKQTTHRRMQSLSVEAAVSGRSKLEAESAFQDAEIALVSARMALINLGFDVPEEFAGKTADEIAVELRFMGIPADLLSTLPAAAKTGNLLPLRATYEGVVVASDAVAGEVIAPTTLIFTLADPRQMLLTLHVEQEHAAILSPGLAVNFRADDGSGQVTGRLAWVSPRLDEKTRTLEVRVRLDNSALRLRDRTFGSGDIVLREEPHAMVVPAEALQSTGDASFVFIRARDYLAAGGPKVFYPRQVRIGARNGDSVELLAGVLPGEVVATRGSAVLLAQLLRGNLGAGCGCHEH